MFEDMRGAGEWEADEYATESYRTVSEWGKENIPSGFYPEGLEYIFNEN